MWRTLLVSLQLPNKTVITSKGSKLFNSRHKIMAVFTINAKYQQTRDAKCTLA